MIRLSEIIHQVKTLIDYAKFGVSMSRYVKNQAGELFVPPHLPNWNSSIKSLATKFTSITGYVENTVTGEYAFGDNKTIEYVNLPLLEKVEYAAFIRCEALKTCILPSVTKIGGYAFSRCWGLEYLELGTLESVTNPFGECKSLHTLIVGKGTNATLPLTDCTNLTQECLHNIIDNLADRKGTSALTLQIGSVNIAKVSDEYKIKLSNKNWNLA